jgi:hypothetical protein
MGRPEIFVKDGELQKPTGELYLEHRFAYYELNINQDGMTLHRYEARPGQPRQATPANFTHETFKRLARDVAAVVP